MNKNDIKILVIEDDLIIAENLKENLMELGYSNVILANDSTHGIALYKMMQPDICLVDIQLEGSPMDGIDMVHSQQIGRNIPVIYLSSFTDEATRERARKTRPAGYLVKPSSKMQIDLALDMAFNAFHSAQDAIPKGQNSILNGNGFFFLKIKNTDFERYEKFFISDIVYLKAEGSYTRIFTIEKSPLVSINLKEVLESINHERLVRCHRSFAVNLDHVNSFDKGYFYVNDTIKLNAIPIGEQYKNEIFKMINKI